MTSFARELWQRAETIHAVTYFSGEGKLAIEEAGYTGWWMGYFGLRAAPLGAASPELVTALFYNFHPSKVSRALPDSWSVVSPTDALDIRARAAAACLRRVSSSVEEIALEVIPALAPAIAAADPAGRGLFACNQPLRREDPVEDLWQLLTSLREHRGDSHVAALRAADLSGVEAHLVNALANDLPEELLKTSRSWSDDEWAAARAGLVARDLVDDAGLTQSGRELKELIEASTDEQAMRLLDPVSDWEGLSALLERVALEVRDGDIINYPNPMGLERI